MNPLHITCVEKDVLINAPFKFDFDNHYSEYRKLTQQAFYGIKNQDILIINKQIVDEQVIANNPSLKLLVLCSTGFDHVDMSLLKKHKIQACNVRGYAGNTVAEHAFLLMMTLVKNFRAQYEAVISGKWSESKQACFVTSSIFELDQKTLVILGKGEIGQSLAHKAQAFGMKVIFSERKNATVCRSGYMPFEQAIRQADVLSLNCELNQDTYHLIDAHVLQQMKPSSFLINVGRGGLINEQDLVKALHDKKIAGFATDVLTEEPPAKNHPLLQLNHLNTIITAHIAWASEEAQVRLFDVVQKNINAFVANHPQNLIS